MNLLSRLESLSKPLVSLIGYAFIGIIGVIDYLTGYEYAFSIFYVLPISIIIWSSGRKPGYFACFVSAAVWLMADISTERSYSHPVIPYWNSLIRLSFFVVITFLISTLKIALEHEKELATTDYLTGVPNTRYFYNVVQMEINRLERNQRSFTIAYIDADDFKSINDSFGHTEGDHALQVIAGSIKARIRNTDMVARLGGDEFAVFFPDTNQDSARVVVGNLHEMLSGEMKKSKWETSFSIGVLTCTVSPRSTNELIKTVDNLMYSAKRDGKNTVKYSIYEP